MSKDQAKEKLGLSGSIIVSASRFVPWKGFGFLIRLMPDILKIKPDAKLVLAGDGPEYKRYKALAEELGLLEKVIFTGAIKREKLAIYLKSSDMFLLASSYEGLSHLILEAMQQCTPSIVSDIGGNPEVVDHEINGLLVPYLDKEAWLGAISSVWQNKELSSRISSSPIPAMPVFEFDQMISSTEKIIIDN